MTSCGEFKEEFQCRKLGFSSDASPRTFVVSQCGPAILYPIWTSLWLLYHLAWLSYDIYEIIDGSENGSSYYVNLTNWSYMLLIVTNLTDVICTLYVHCRRTDIIQDSYELGEETPTSWYLQFSWFLFEVNNTVAPIVTILFYSLLSPSNDPVSTEYHAINTVYVVLNFFACAKPVRVLHFIYPSIYGIIYSIFSVIYQLGGNNPPIYTLLDWNKPGTAIAYSIVLVLVAVPVVHMTFFGLYKLRVFINERCCSSDKTENVV